MSLAVFEKFLLDLHTELDKLEFQHYDPEDTVRRACKMRILLKDQINTLTSVVFRDLSGSSPYGARGLV